MPVRRCRDFAARVRPAYLAALVAATCLGVHGASAQAWTRGHGGADNAGFADVNSDAITAGTPRATAVNLGIPAPGVGLVVAQNGAAYLAAMDGQLTAIRANGTTFATVHVPDGHILAAPLIGSDGSVYVAASMGTPVSDQDRSTARAWLYRFTPHLEQMWQRPLPVQGKETGAALALNATGAGAGEVIAVAAVEKVATSFRVNLAGFSPDGALLFNKDVGGAPMDEHGISITDLQKMLCWPFADACQSEDNAAAAPGPQDRLPADVNVKPIGIAIADDDVMVVSDGFNGVRGYRYTPGAGLTRVFEKYDGRHLTSAPAVMDSKSVYGVEGDRIAFSGPLPEHVTDIQLAGNTDTRAPVEATPTRLANGHLVTVDRSGDVTVIDNGVPVAHIDSQAESIAGVAASRNMFYVSTASALLSFDAATNAPVGSFPWQGGGQVPVAIGSGGQVYAFAGGTLYIFQTAKPAEVAARTVRVRRARMVTSPPNASAVATQAE